VEEIIKAKNKFSINVKELLQFKELFYFFAWRDIKVKYSQTFLGVLWAILQPVFMTLVFTIFLGDAIAQKTNLPIPYPVFALSGMLLWTIFSSGLSNAANSMVTNANIIKKIYFPRLIIPISSVLVALVDFFVALIIFVIVIFYYDVKINVLSVLYLPLSVLITCLSTIGLGSLLAALNIKYRDVRYVLPFFIQGLLFLSPVLYPAAIAKNEVVQWALKLNPLAGALELMRGVFVGYTVNFETVYLSVATSLVLFLLGIVYFRKTESYFADLA
jgi:lipopolysaccharide transport system permease protein